MPACMPPPPSGDVAEIERLIAAGEKLNIQDAHSRTPLHVAAFRQPHAAARALLKLGANPNALEIDRYDIITIAAVANDVEMLKIALEGGGNARDITSRYDGTALIAAAHLGHAEVVRMLIAAKAPLDHVNNLGWTALIEVDRARQRRQGPRRHAQGADRGRRRRQHPRPREGHAARARPRARLRRDGPDAGSGGRKVRLIRSIMMVCSCALAAVTGLSTSTTTVRAQTYPSRVVTIIVPVAPGGVSDTLARALAQQLAQAWGQQVIVENRGGAAHTIGAAAVAKGTPDGYTLLLTEGTALIPSLYSRLALRSRE